MSTVAFAAPPIRRRTITVAGGVIAAQEIGPADRPLDVIFLHANGFNAGTYRGILAPLGERFRILAVDQRGHGHTTLPAEPFASNAWTVFRDDLLALLEALGETPRVLSGHSMGGTACLMAAAERADAARDLVLFDPVIVPPEHAAAIGPDGMRNSPLALGAMKRRASFPDRETAVQGWIGRGAFKTWPEETIRDYVADGLVETADGDVRLACAPEWEASNFSSHFHDPWTAFARAVAPIHILKAEIGSTCRIEERQDALIASGKVRVDLIAGTSHFLPMERPDLVRAALTEALD